MIQEGNGDGDAYGRRSYKLNEFDIEAPGRRVWAARRAVPICRGRSTPGTIRGMGQVGRNGGTWGGGVSREAVAAVFSVQADSEKSKAVELEHSLVFEKRWLCG